jgi:hypothetical protein
MYIDKGLIKIERPISYSLRGFGFLINISKNNLIDGNSYAQVVVVEPSNILNLIK